MEDEIYESAFPCLAYTISSLYISLVIKWSYWISREWRNRMIEELLVSVYRFGRIVDVSEEQEAE